MSSFPRGRPSPGAVVSWEPRDDAGTTRVMARRRRPRSVALADDLDPAKMTDTGMWIWSGVLFVLILVLSYFAAVWWQRRKQKEKDRADMR